MSLIKCQECGKEISDKANICPNCGCPQTIKHTSSIEENISSNNPKIQTESQNNTTEENNSNQKIKLRKAYWIISILLMLCGIGNIAKTGGICLLFAGIFIFPPFINFISQKRNKNSKKLMIAICVILIAIFSFTSDNSNNSSTSDTNTGNAVSQVETKEQEWANYYEENQIQLTFVDSELLYEYGEYYAGQYVCTAIKIEDTSAKMLKSKTSNNTGYFFSLIFNFENEEECNPYKNGEYVTIAGQVEGKSVGSSINVNNCHIIGSGFNAQSKQEELSQGIEEQKKNIEEIKAQAEAQASEAKESSKQEYINSCNTVSYKDIERNPSNYNGTHIKITGKVIQVSDGWFNSQTLRVKVGENYWYVTYTRENENESRILENDNITVYGDCKGVTSYTSVLGSQVTIPSISAKYIENN